jgi:hypothetical protein
MIVSDLPSPVEASNQMTNSYRGFVQPFPPPIKSTTGFSGIMPQGVHS